MAQSPELVLEYLKQVEALADDVLTDKADLTELSKKRDKIREGQRAVRKLSNNSFDNEVWLLNGNLFLSLNKQQADKVLEKEQDQIEKNISKLNKSIKEKVNKLYDAEKKPELKGFNLVPISKEEKQSLFEIAGKKSNEND